MDEQIRSPHTGPAVAVPTVTLNTGARLPVLGFGTARMEGTECVAAVRSALEHGYRLLDTATKYANERAVGLAVHESGVPREEIVLTTKLAGGDQGYEETLRAAQESARRLGTDYLDLYLIHWPNPTMGQAVASWKAILTLVDDGLVRSPGVSNFKPAHLQRLYDETGVWPAVNQIQISPRLARGEPRAFHREHGIVTESWSPLGHGEGVPEAEPVRRLAEQHGRTPAQIILRWHVQQGLVAIPKAASPERQAQNLAVFDFELSDEDVQALSGLDLGESAAWDSDTHEEF